ncbi:MAG: VCBS repeat-containing protein, partial [Kofleriaceae bacterium]|nr:VCBS repeat-containing protein [Kofleriaceae bacterium]
RRPVGALALLLGGCSPAPPPGAPSDAAPTPPDAQRTDAAPVDAEVPPPLDGSAYDRVNAYVAERDRLDRQVWGDELEAQRHATAFVELWDALRGATDAAAVLAAFPVGALVVGHPGEPSASADGVTLLPLSAAPRALDQAAWAALVRGLADDGLRLRHSVWHHVAFRPAPPRSTFDAELHLIRSGTDERLSLRARLIVDWQPSTAPATPRPARIDATEAWLTRRAGPPAFVPSLQLPIGRRPPTPVLAADLGGDGRVELVVPRTNAAYRPTADGTWLRLTLANHPLKQPDAALLADLDGDGHLDLLVAGRDAGGAYRLGLYRGHEGGLFPDPPRVAFAPAEPLRRVRVLTAGDIDGDGDLDLFVGQHRGPFDGGATPTPLHDADDGPPSYLLRNDGRGGFTDVTADAGLTVKRHRRAQSGSLVDLDDDGDLDLVTVSDFSGVDLFANDGRGRFTDVTQARVDDRALLGAAHALADFDGDGRLDLVATGVRSPTVHRLNGLGLQRPGLDAFTRARTALSGGDRLYLGRRDGRLQRADLAAAGSAWGRSWGVAAFDRENDGDLDLFVARGDHSGRTARDYDTQFWRHDVYFDARPLGQAAAEIALIGRQAHIGSGLSWHGFQPDRLYVRRPDGYRDEAHLWGLGSAADGRTALAFDYDEDGR